MSNSIDNNPKILKLIGIFIAVFFLLMIAFNIWMKASLDKPLGLSIPKTATTKTNPDIKKTSAVAGSVVSQQKTKEIAEPYGGQAQGEQRLLLQ